MTVWAFCSLVQAPFDAWHLISVDQEHADWNSNVETIFGQTLDDSDKLTGTLNYADFLPAVLSSKSHRAYLASIDVEDSSDPQSLATLHRIGACSIKNMV